MAAVDTLLVAYIAKVDHRARVDRKVDLHQDMFDRTLKAVEEGRLHVQLDASAKGQPWYDYAEYLLQGDESGAIVQPMYHKDSIEKAVIPVLISGEANGREISFKVDMSLRELQLAALANNHEAGTSKEAVLPDIAHWADRIVVGKPTHDALAPIAQEMIEETTSITPSRHVSATTVERQGGISPNSPSASPSPIAA